MEICCIHVHFLSIGFDGNLDDTRILGELIEARYFGISITCGWVVGRVYQIPP